MTSELVNPSVPEGFEWAVPASDEAAERFAELPTREPGTAWSPIDMRLVTTDDYGHQRMFANMPWCGSETLILRDAAIGIVGDLLRHHGEVLPLMCADAELALFSAPLVRGALDLDKSHAVRFGSGGIMALKSAIFFPEVLGGVKAFRLSEMPRGSLFMARDLADAIVASGLGAGTEYAGVAS